MDAVHAAYHAGKNSTGAEMIDSNCVWVKSLNKGIEWTEEGAEYEHREVKEELEGGRIKTTLQPVKVKEGVLKFKIAE